MTTSRQLNIVLCGLTGFGNTVLKALLKDSRVAVQACFTVKYANPFPYYPEEQLIDLCDKLRVQCHDNMKVSTGEGWERLRSLSPDLILVATFNQILTRNVLELPPLGVVNVHPSLLPKLRGACPTNAAILKGETTTGLTAHYMGEELDTGDLLLQRVVPIGREEYDGELRAKLARLAGDMVPPLLDLFAGFTKPKGTPQDNTRATRAPKPLPEEGFLETETDPDRLARKIRALNPIPGTSILLRGERIPVQRYEWLLKQSPAGVRVENGWVDLALGGHAIRLFRTSTAM